MFALDLKRFLADPLKVINPIVFLFLAVMVFALVVPGQGLKDYGGAVLWVVVLLTTVLSLDDLYRKGFDDGTLEQVLIHAPVPFWAVLRQLIFHWLQTGFLIVCLSPVLGSLMGVPVETLPTLALALLLGTPSLTLIGAMGSALTVGFSRGGVLLALIVLPLFVPVLIFGAGAVSEHIIGAAVSAQLSWLLFISMVALTVGPFATLAGLKISVQLH